MRKPLRQFCKDEGISERKAYDERYAGRLVFTKVGSRVFIDDADAEHWRSLAPKIGRVGDVALQAAERAIETLGEAVKAGDVDRASAVKRLRAVAATFGLNSEQEQEKARA
jgi:hypothetical protein